MSINQRDNDFVVAEEQSTRLNLGNPHNEYIEAEHTTYEEVDGIVPNEDNQEMLCSTFRAWFIGLSFVILFSFHHTYYYYTDQYNVIFSDGHMFLLSFFIGKIWAHFVPQKSIRLWPKSSYQFSLNPGPFTIKEHVLIVLMVNFASDIYYPLPIDILKLTNKQTISHFWLLLFLIGSQLIGHGFAGIMRRFLVWPSSMVWPHIMPYIVLFRTLHNEKTIDGRSNSDTKWKLTRRKFFFISLTCYFIYSWFPDFIMPILMTFSLVCFFNPNNNLHVALTGSWTLGFGSLSLDWNTIASKLQSPLIVPAWSQVNILIGFIIIACIVSPIMFFSNMWNVREAPVMRFALIFQRRHGSVFQLNEPGNFHLISSNETLHKLYEPVYFDLATIIQYACQLAFYPALFIHTLFHYKKDLIKQFYTSLQNRDNDIHCQLMSQYKETPEWWFTILFLLPLILIIIVCQYLSLISWYHLLLAFFIVSLLILPFGILEAHTGIYAIHAIDYPVTYLLASIILRHNPLGALTFHYYINHAVGSVIHFVSFLKVSHYMRIPPRVTFIMTIVCSILSCIVNYITSYPSRNQLIHVECFKTYDPPPICKAAQSQRFREFKILSIMGPAKLLGHLSHYSPLLWMILAGALLPGMFWFIEKKYHHRFQWLKYIHVPIILIPGLIMIDTNGGVILTWLLIGFISNVCISRWTYERYARLLSIALNQAGDISLALASILLYSNIQMPEWWGTGSSYEENCLTEYSI